MLNVNWINIKYSALQRFHSSWKESRKKEWHNFLQNCRIKTNLAEIYSNIFSLLLFTESGKQPAKMRIMFILVFFLLRNDNVEMKHKSHYAFTRWLNLILKLSIIWFYFFHARRRRINIFLCISSCRELAGWSPQQIQQSCMWNIWNGFCDQSLLMKYIEPEALLTARVLWKMSQIKFILCKKRETIRINKACSKISMNELITYEHPLTWQSSARSNPLK